MGDLRDPAALARACAGVTSMFLVSSPTQDQVELETNAIEAAERAGVERIVKVSNIPIVGLEPSCLLTLRDEYLALLPANPGAEAVASATRLPFCREDFTASTRYASW